jgi:hypothetical protein
MCYFENLILQEVISVINKEGIEICALMFDGLMVYGDYYEDDELLREIEKAVNEKFVGLDMKFDFKIHDNTIELPEDFDENKIYKNDGVWNDLDATQKVFKLYPHWVNCKDELYVFDKQTGLWDTNDTSHLKIITSLKDELHVLFKDLDGNISKAPESYGTSLHLSKRIPILMKTLCSNDNWLKQKIIFKSW